MEAGVNPFSRVLAFSRSLKCGAGGCLLVSRLESGGWLRPNFWAMTVFTISPEDGPYKSYSNATHIMIQHIVLKRDQLKK